MSMKDKTIGPVAIADLKPADFNPRVITPEALEGLKSSVAEFGDISGIVYNLRLGCLVAGHQRVAALRAKFGDGLTIEPDGQGNGRIDTPAGPFGVRFVSWDETRTNAAMLVANNPAIHGDWTDAAGAMLRALEQDMGNGFEALKLDELRAVMRDDSEMPSLRKVEALPAPAMAWALVGIPTVRFGEIAADIERMAKLNGTIVETTVSNVGAEQ